MSHTPDSCRGFSTVMYRTDGYPQRRVETIEHTKRWRSMRNMNHISTLIRQDIQRLSGGRISSLVEIDGEQIRLIASARRRKSIQAGMRDGMLELSVPSVMSDYEIIDSARRLMAKVKAKESSRRRIESDPALMQRALHLAQVWLNNEVRPNSVVWSDRQNKRWGSCSIQSKAIRLSTQLHGLPQWVIDGVLIHELAHLKYPDHSQAFRDFTRRYPRTLEADAFLDGMTYAQHRGGDEAFPTAYD